MNNPDEVKALLRKVTAYCPSMKMTEDTPLAWAEALQQFTVGDCLQAVANLGGAPLEPGKARYIEPGHVAWEVRRIRERRVAAFDIAQASPPSGMSAVEYIAWIRRQRELAANGEPLDATPALEPRPARDLIARLRRSIAVT